MTAIINTFATAMVFMASFSTAALAVEGDEARLLQYHARMMEMHLKSDISIWEEVPTADDFFVADGRQIQFPSPEDRVNRMGGYLANIRFLSYVDTQDPIVRISDDGTLGWVVVAIDARGVHMGDNNAETPVHYASTWISLFEKRDGQWVLTGNVSDVVDLTKEE